MSQFHIVALTERVEKSAKEGWENSKRSWEGKQLLTCSVKFGKVKGKVSELG